MAEGEGFEPSIHLAAYTRVPGVRLRPLGHPSVVAEEGFEPPTHGL